MTIKVRLWWLHKEAHVYDGGSHGGEVFQVASYSSFPLFFPNFSFFFAHNEILIFLSYKCTSALEQWILKNAL